jgi:hypothetical protein
MENFCSLSEIVVCDGNLRGGGVEDIIFPVRFLAENTRKSKMLSS